MNGTHHSQENPFEAEHFKVCFQASEALEKIDSTYSANINTNKTQSDFTVCEKEFGRPSLASPTSGTAPPIGVEFTKKDSPVNMLSCAYSESGYPTSLCTGNFGSVICGAFVELRNPSLNSITFPPDEMIIVSETPCESTEEIHKASTASMLSHFSSFSDLGKEVPLLRVVWKRGSHLLNGLLAEKSFTPTTAGALSNSPTSFGGVVLPRITSDVTIQRLIQCPEGVCDVQTSPRLNEIVLGFQPSVEHAGGTTSQVNDTTECGENANDSGSDGNNKKGGSGGSDFSEGINPLPETKIPSGEEVSGDMPIQTTLITANSFSHLTTYGVIHQDGRILSTTPLQSLTASIATRRITAHSLFFLSTIVGKSYVAPGRQSGGSPQVLHGAEVKMAKKNSAVRKQQGPGAPSTPKGAVVHFEDVRVGGGGGGGGANTGGTDRINAATLHLAVEPYLLLGNQSGDLLLFSVFEEKILQRLNYSGGGCGKSYSEGSPIPSKQLVGGTVTCIVEIECGIEKHLEVVIDRASSSRMKNENTFKVPSVSAEGVPPSLFAAGFDNGHILLVSVTPGGAWLSGHLTSFGPQPIHGISVQTPHFFLRLWSRPRGARGARGTALTPLHKVQEQQEEREEGNGKDRVGGFPTMQIISATTLTSGGDRAVVAINCGGGMLRLARVSNLEVDLCRTLALANNTAGDFLAMQWVPSSTEFTLYPDLIVVTSEADCMMVYRFLQSGGSSRSKVTNASSLPEESGSLDLAPGKFLASSILQPTGGSLVFLERRCFHRSWIGDLCLLPVSGAHMLVATSYDGQSSFWPIYNGATRLRLNDSFLPPPCENESFIQECFSDCIIQDDDNWFAHSRLTRTVLADGPVAALPLHADMAVRCTVGGAGCSHFFVSLCLRGRVKFWEVRSVFG